MKPDRLYVIGLTGNIATGKSVVAGMLAELGAEVIDADALAHQVTQAGTPAWQRVVDEFGQDILRLDGEIDRARLGAHVFSDPQALARLEAIVHPAVIAESERLLQDLQNGGMPSAAGTAGRGEIIGPGDDDKQAERLGPAAEAHEDWRRGLHLGRHDG